MRVWMLMGRGYERLLLMILWGLAALLVGCKPGAGTSTPVTDERREIPVLMYHEITSAKPAGQTVIAPETFAAHMQYLAAQHYVTPSAGELLEIRRGVRAAPQRAVVLTLDDGWKSQSYAVELLQKHKFKATFFIITGAAEGRFGPDYFTWAQVEALAREPRFTIGSHSVTHPWNPRDSLLTWAKGLPPGRSIADVRRELADSKRVLEARLGRPVTLWAWPCGWHSPELDGEALQAGYAAHFTTHEFRDVPTPHPGIPRYFVDGRWSAAELGRWLEGNGR